MDKKLKTSRFDKVCKTLDLTDQEKLIFIKQYSKNQCSDIETMILKNRNDYECMLKFLYSCIDKYADQWRKRCIAAISEYLKLSGYVDASGKMEYIKSIACRAANVDSFNKMTIAQLRNVYNSFVKQNNITRRVKTYSQITHQKHPN